MMQKLIRKLLKPLIQELIAEQTAELHSSNLNQVADLARLIVDANADTLTIQSRDFLSNMNINPKTCGIHGFGNPKRESKQ